jgi:hypothetical protein
LSRARLAAVLCGVLLLSGCGWTKSWFGSIEASAPAPVAACPDTIILRPLAQTAVFAPGAAKQPLGVAFYGVLSDVGGKCDVGPDALRARLDIVVVAERGPAAGRADTVDLQYFVAVTGPGDTILSKRSFPVRIQIPGDARRAGVSDHIEETIALGGRASSELSIVVGFQQTPEVVDFYRKFRGR